MLKTSLGRVAPSETGCGLNRRNPLARLRNADTRVAASGAQGTVQAFLKSFHIELPR
jgi:hypothetical protein